MKTNLHKIFSLIQKHLKKAFQENLSLKLVSVLLTLTLFALVAGESVQMSKRVNVEYITPEDLMIVNTVPFEFEIVLSGQKSAMGIVRGQEYYYKVDLTGVGPGTSRIGFSTRQLNLPRGIVVSSILPSRIYPKLEKILTKTIPVKLKLTNEKEALRRFHLRMEPEAVEIQGPESKVSLISEIETESFDLPFKIKAKSIDVNLLPLHEQIKIPKLSTGKIKVHIEKKIQKE